MYIRLTLFLLFLCIVFPLWSQDKSIPKSPVTLVYRISNKQASELCQQKKTNKSEGIESMLTLCVDTLRGQVQTLPNDYAVGDYLLVSAQGPFLQCRLVTVAPFAYRLLNNQTDMSLMLFDRKSGKPITDAKVKVDGRPIRFNKQTQTYRRNRSNKQGALSIEANGITAHYKLYRDINRSFWKQLTGGLWNGPAKYVTRPVVFVVRIPVDGVRSIGKKEAVGSIKPFADVVESIKEEESIGAVKDVKAFFSPEKAENEDYSFMVLSKPKYRPGDTLRMKAYVDNKKKSDTMRLVINNQMILKLTPYRIGFYESSFVLADSLKLRLDRNHTVSLADGNIPLVSAYFQYEDYELQDLPGKLSILSDKYSFDFDEPAEFRIQVTDENDMPSPDGLAEVYLQLSEIIEFEGEKLTIPYLLWKDTVKLDHKGEAAVLIPDSIRLANVTFTADLRARHNEQWDLCKIRLNKLVREQLITTISSDTLTIRLERDRKKVEGVSARLSGQPMKDTILMLPATIRISPLVENYKIACGKLTREINLKGEEKVKCRMRYHNGNVVIEVHNPANIPLMYTVYKGNKKKKQGTSGLEYRAPAGKKDWHLSVQYIWAGEVQNLEYSLPGHSRNINISSDIPSVVYPGQKLNIGLTATNDKGKPMPDVDLTAWGYSEKFGRDQYFNVSNYTNDEAAKGRKQYNSFESASSVTISSKLDYERWRQPLNLDSVQMFRFANPGKNIFDYSFPSTDGKSYISPYLVHDGKLLPVHILYIDNKPVYFNHTTTEAPYVFEVTPGKKHYVSMRTTDCTFGFYCIPDSGEKSVISADPYAMAHYKNSDKYSYEEQCLIKKHLLPLKYPVSNYRQADLVYLEYNNHIELLKPEQGKYSRDRHIAGPFPVPEKGLQPVSLTDGLKELNFERESGEDETFEYEPVGNGWKMRSYDFDMKMEQKLPSMNWNAYPYTRSDIDTIGIDVKKRNYLRYAFGQSYNYNYGSNNLTINLELNDSIQNKAWCWVMYNYKQNRTSLYPVKSSKFKACGNNMMILLMKDKSYYAIDSLFIDCNVHTIMRMPIDSLYHSVNVIDSLKHLPYLIDYLSFFSGLDISSAAWNTSLGKPIVRSVPEEIAYNDNFKDKITIRGTVKDTDGYPIPDVNIWVKGTKRGTATDSFGAYRLVIPKGYRKLAFSHISYETVDSIPEKEGIVDIEMKEAVYQLPENIVIGYGRAVSKMVASFSVVQRSHNAEPKLVRSETPEKDDVPETDAREMMRKIMDNEAFLDGLSQARSLRKNFSDEAFWQPALTTNNSGKAIFTTTLPDDITKWRFRYVGLVPGKASGSGEQTINSLKLLMARLDVPRFMVEGDRADITGKVVNYTGDTVKLHTAFSVDSMQQSDNPIDVGLQNITETQNITTGADTSLLVRYMLTRDNGYSDGEERSIPIIRKGTSERTGDFYVLRGDTTITLSYDANKGPVYMQTDNQVQDIALGGARYMRDYKHLCNEQSASRLKVLIQEKMLYQLAGKHYLYDDQINWLIQRLENNVSPQGTWSWFTQGPTEEWISRNATEALLLARDAGFKVRYGFYHTSKSLVDNFDKASEDAKITTLQTLSLMNPKENYRSLFDQINPEHLTTFTDSLQWMDMAVGYGIDIKPERLLKRMRRDAYFCYFQESTGQRQEDDLNATLAAYRVFRSLGTYPELLPWMHDYILYKRKNGYWINTYLTAKVLATIIPDMISAENNHPLLEVISETTSVISNFPQKTVLPAGKPITLKKTGYGTLYISVWQDVLQPDPEPEDKGFAIETKFYGNYNTTAEQQADSLPVLLKNGQPASLEVKVLADDDFDYVMIEVPIPAGCSYSYKSQWNYNETYREHFRDRVCIYVRSLTRGAHSFRISLHPRFTGSYYMNPARAECMYMPLYYGQTGGKQVIIEN